MVSWPDCASAHNEKLCAFCSRTSSGERRDGYAQASRKAVRLLRRRHCWRSICRIASQVFLIGVLLFSNVYAVRAADISDVNLVTGSQLKDALFQVMKDIPNVEAAVNFSSKEQNLKLDFDALVAISFRVDKKDPGGLFFIPFRGTDNKDQLKHVVVLAQTPKSSRVLLGTISTEDPKNPQVTDEKVVVEGKVQQGDGHLKSFFKCAGTNCLGAAAGCLYGGPEWFPCFCLWCGGSAIGCGIVELLP